MAGHHRPPQGHRRDPGDRPARHPGGRDPGPPTRSQGRGRPRPRHQWAGLVADDDLAEALTRLPAKQKQAVAYHYLAGLPYADVAAILGGSAEAARRAAADGVATLRRSYPGATPQATQQAKPGATTRAAARASARKGAPR